MGSLANDTPDEWDRPRINFTTFAIVLVIMSILLAWAIVKQRPSHRPPLSRPLEKMRSQSEIDYADHERSTLNTRPSDDTLPPPLERVMKRDEHKQSPSGEYMEEIALV